MSINTSKKQFALTIVITLGFSLFYWGITTKLGDVLNGYTIVFLLLGVAFFFFKAKIESAITSKFISNVLTLVMAIVLGFSISSMISKYVDGLWWLYIMLGALLYAYSEEVVGWLV